MKKLVLVLSLVAVFAFVNVASAATLQEQIAALQAQLATLMAQAGGTTVASSVPTITGSLTIGSKGAEVEALQRYLEDEGLLVMPVGVAYGYFGPLTKAAVVEWQKANDVSPASGYFGPISRAALDTLAATAPVAGLPAGCTSAAGYSPTTGASCASGATAPVVGLDNADGSLTASLDSYVTNATLKKGETKDVYALKLQASTGNVAVTRFDVRMSVRPWLYFSKLVLKDTSGNVIAEKAITGSSDVTELTSGSDYLVRFDNINYVVTPNADKTVIVAATVLSSTDKLTSDDVNVTVKIGLNGIRTVNGKGYSESLSEDTGRTVTLSSTGSTGNIVVRLSSSSPSTDRFQTITSGGTTDGVILGAFDFKTENQSGTLESMNLALTDSLGGQSFSTIIKRLSIVDGSNTYYADSVASTSAFSDLNIDLTKDVWKTLVVKAEIADADDFTSGKTASTTVGITTVSTTNPAGIDSNYGTLTATVSTVTSAKTMFSKSAIAVTSSSASYTAVGDSKTLVSLKYNVSLTNTGSDAIYVSAAPGVMFATSTAASMTYATGTLSVMYSAPMGGDSSGVYYVIPSGSTRSFEVNGSLDNAVSSDARRVAGTKDFRITTLYFDDDTTDLNEFSLDAGLDNLRVAPVLSTS